MDFLTSSNTCLNVFESVSSAGHLFNYSVKEKTELTKEHRRENKCVCFRTLTAYTSCCHSLGCRAEGIENLRLKSFSTALLITILHWTQWNNW